MSEGPAEPALIASHFALYGFPLLDVLWRNAHVVHFHGPWAHESAAEGESPRSVFFKHGIERAIYASARRFVVLSQAFRDVLVRRYGVREDRIDIVPGGVQADTFDTGLSRAEAREKLGWPKDRVILVRSGDLLVEWVWRTSSMPWTSSASENLASSLCLRARSGSRAGCFGGTGEFEGPCEAGGICSRCRFAGCVQGC
jgi:hypothetical protein